MRERFAALLNLAYGKELGEESVRTMSLKGFYKTLNWKMLLMISKR